MLKEVVCLMAGNGCYRALLFVGTLRFPNKFLLVTRVKYLFVF